jgi:hypothetical protein
MDAINRSPIRHEARLSNVIAAAHESGMEESVPFVPQDEKAPSHAGDLPLLKNPALASCSRLTSHLSHIFRELSLIGLGLLCQLGSIVAQPVSDAALLGGAENGPVKDRIETVIEKPESVYDDAGGQKCAKNASTVAQKMHTTGYCYRGVKAALAKSGLSLTGKFAYQAANQLAKLDEFKEISVTAKDLASLKPGSVVVWGKSIDTPYGHISIALGDGREASDHIETQFTRRGQSTFRVFIPVKDAPLVREPAIDFMVARLPSVSLPTPPLPGLR